jgi:hypothetical protein
MFLAPHELVGLAEAGFDSLLRPGLFPWLVKLGDGGECPRLPMLRDIRKSSFAECLNVWVVFHSATRNAARVAHM